MQQGDPPEDYRQSHLQRGNTYDANLAADPFDAYMAKFERNFLLTAIPSLFPNAAPRYLDFACGTGRITATVAPLSAEAIGVDISSTMLAQARPKCPTVNFIECDLTQAEANIGTFDLATSFRFFGNAQQELRIRVLNVLHSLLRPYAYLVINSHRNPQSLAALLNSATGGGNQGMDLSYFKLKDLLRSCGFKIVQCRPIGVALYRSKLLMNADSNSAAARRSESFFSSSAFAPIAPDTVIVAQRLN